MATCTWSIPRTFAILFHALRQIWHRPGIFDEFLQRRHHLRTREKFAEKVDFASQLFVRNRLHEFFCHLARHRIVLCQLCGGGSRNRKRLPFTGQLGDQAHGLRARGVDGAARKKQIAYECIPQVALEAGNAAESGNKAKAQLGECKPRHLIGDDDVTRERELQPATQASTVDGSDGDERSRVNRIQNGMNALEKTADPFRALLFRNRGRLIVEFAKIATCRKYRFSSAGNNAGGSFWGQRSKRRNKLFQLAKHSRANFIGWLMVERQLRNSFTPLPAKRFARKTLHACCLLTARASSFASEVSRLPLVSYIAFISAEYRALTASRRIFPLAVSNPLSAVNALGMIL